MADENLNTNDRAELRQKIAEVVARNIEFIFEKFGRGIEDQSQGCDWISFDIKLPVKGLGCKVFIARPKALNKINDAVDEAHF